jgi:hypothetical protein
MAAVTIIVVDPEAKQQSPARSSWRAALWCLLVGLVAGSIATAWLCLALATPHPAHEPAAPTNPVPGPSGNPLPRPRREPELPPRVRPTIPAAD